MKKEVSLLVLFTFCFITSHSQAGNHKSYLGISIGPSFPVSHFAKDNLSDNSSGFANAGQAVTISYARLIGKRFGVAGNLQGQRNPLNVHSLEEQFSKTGFAQGIWTGTYPGEPHPPLPTVIYPNLKFEKESWLLGSLLLGGYGEFTLGNEKLAFTAKAMAGAAYATAPEANGSSITDTATASFVQTKTSAFGISYSMTAGLKYDINKGLCLLTTVEYFETSNLKFDASTATFTATHGTPGSPEYSVSQAMTRGEPRQTISSINLLLGIAIKL